MRMDTEQLNHRFDFYAKSDNEEEGIVASNYYVTASTSYFTPEKNEGYVVVGRGNTLGDGFEIRVIYKRKLLN
ncbi:hypothetical protein I0P70_04270 [Pontibacter sp. FD36]|uniref:hypothetical protein n=1 Tax=Pontibacter sp. FD36 TaxID=2789860 RepID=UPI0018A9DA2D|nr:hypothetical protein [Pontibacter sp. FD36]MBF8962454.1 hypothetical protein [Pontibacter sp. FD36]